ncbi:hypothetical protein ACWDRR_38130 [Kitasatospora sp. NPDC003701]
MAAAPEPALADVCRTAGEGRTHFAHRARVREAGPAELSCGIMRDQRPRMASPRSLP